jgi:RNA-directed DNA polymerase
MTGMGASNSLEGQGARESGAALSLMEAVVARGNMFAGYDRVMRNKGAAGVDEMSLALLIPNL